LQPDNCDYFWLSSPSATKSAKQENAWRLVCVTQTSHFFVAARATKQVAIAVARHPLGARKMAVEGAARSVWLGDRIDPKDKTSGLAPIGVVCLGIKEPEISDDVLLVIRRKHGIDWRKICDIRIERW
jgi:hypothetical protein